MRVVDQVVAEHGRQVPLRDRHADRVGEPLAERAGGGLDAGRVAVLRMAGRQRAELAEALDLRRSSSSRSRADAAARRSASSRGRPRARSGRGPARPDRAGSNFRKRREQHGGDVGRAHRQAGVAAISPAPPRPWRARGWRWPCAGARAGVPDTGAAARRVAALRQRLRAAAGEAAARGGVGIGMMGHELRVRASSTGLGGVKEGRHGCPAAASAAMHRAGEKIRASVDGPPSSHVSFQS